MDWQPDERWAPAPGWETEYEVSTTGRVRKIGGGIIGQWLSSQGYPLVRLAHPRKMARVHRLVAAAFIPNPEGKPSINHIDCVRHNNVVSNLEWCTQAENLRHSEKLGRMQRDYWCGRRPPSARLSDEDVRQIRRAYELGDYSWAEIGRMFGISKRAAGRAITGETYADVR